MGKLSMSVVAAGQIALPSPDGVALSGCGKWWSLLLVFTCIYSGKSI